jgi:hypothetical protein
MAHHDEGTEGMADEAIRLERARDGEHWRLRWEGSDLEGHAYRGRGFTAEPVGEGGQALYKLDFGEDTEGHGARVRVFDADGNEEDAEGHGKWRRFTAEPAGEEDGQPLYKLDFGEDTEGHGKMFFR